MQYCELSDYDMPAGALTIWRPRANLQLVALDHRPLAPQHERHVTVHSPGQRSDWIGVAFEVHARFEPEAMRRALWSWHKRHESLRSTVRLEASAWRRLLITPEAVEIDATGVTEFATGAEVADHLQAVFAEGINPHQWPHLLTATVVPKQMAFEPPRFLVVFGADHSVMDAYSLVMAVTELQQLYMRALNGNEVSDEGAAVGSYVDFSALEREIAHRHSDGETLARWREFLGAGEPQFPAFPGSRSGNRDAGHQRSFHGPLLSAEETARAHRAARSRGYGMKTAVLAALAAAGQETTASPALRFVMPMHTRTADYQHSIGWFVGLSPVTIALHRDPAPEQDQFGVLLERCEEALTHARDDAALPFPVIEDRLGIRSNPRFVVSFLDLRHVAGADRFDAVRACALRCPVSATGEVYLWITRALSGLNISARLSDDPAEVAVFEQFLVAAREALLAFPAGQESDALAA